MKLNFYAVLLCFLIFSFGCSDKKDPVTTSQTFHDFIGVTDYILGQLNVADSSLVAPLEITTIDGHSDSLWLKRGFIRPLAKEFLSPVIDSIHMYKYFSEKSFMDLTINAFTFSYDPKIKLPEDIHLKRWDVYVDPQNQQIQRVYILKEQKTDSGLLTRQLTWRTNEFFKINTIVEKQNGVRSIKEEKVIWNFDSSDSQTSY